MRVGVLLDALLDRQGMRLEMARARVLEEWAQCVGERIAQVARPRSITESTLFVEVRSSAWLMELDMMKRDLLRSINQGRGAARIEKIVFVLAEERR